MAPRTRSQTGSIPKKVVPFGDEVPTRGATTRLGRKAVTKPVKKKKTENAQERLLLEPHLPNPPAQLDLSKPLPRVGLSETALELPLAADAPTGQPRIFYGEDAPYPRWRTILDQRPLGEDLEKDLIRTHPGRTHIPGVAPGSHPRANDYTIGLGCVKWDFEPGPAAGWGGLTGHQLYEQACMRLRAALDDPWARWQLQDAIRKGENARYIAYVENPVPPLVRFGGRGALQVPPNDPLIVRIKENAYKIDHIVKNKPKWLDMQEFERPSLAWRPGEVEPDMGDYSRFVGLMKNHRFGTLGPPGYQDPSFDPTAKLNAKPVGIQPPTGGTGAAANAAGGSAVQQTEKAVGNLPTLSGQNPETSEAQSVAGDAKRLMQNGEYTGVWFVVFVLFSGLFLYLFLYAIKIIRCITSTPREEICLSW
ncbi:uncharacterized protein N7496_001588 [Penicillium cataractarum]|uniref:Uncharacterized protein n=1 Tax=Penicillium cataractarum TaxID=2100454 RepID=A0A9W9VWJ3_9EURO|nr:uncharacterized protein N7496_001588 [Penicillium cataractarum]KAJ5390520.1 hypothetical protein N7496_001588 [Penicillium cataractarum]